MPTGSMARNSEAKENILAFLHLDYQEPPTDVAVYSSYVSQIALPHEHMDKIYSIPKKQPRNVKENRSIPPSNEAGNRKKQQKDRDNEEDRQGGKEVRKAYCHRKEY